MKPSTFCIIFSALIGIFFIFLGTYGFYRGESVLVVSLYEILGGWGITQAIVMYHKTKNKWY